SFLLPVGSVPTRTGNGRGEVRAGQATAQVEGERAKLARIGGRRHEVKGHLARDRAGIHRHLSERRGQKTTNTRGRVRLRKVVDPRPRARRAAKECYHRQHCNNFPHNSPSFWERTDTLAGPTQAHRSTPS